MFLTQAVSRFTGADVDPAVGPDNQHLACEMHIELLAMA
jgi:hypothetical protein